MKLGIQTFLQLKFRHEFHEYHKEGNKCIYQDLIKDEKNIREILFYIANDPEYLNANKYDQSTLLKYDHMRHFIYCILYGFRKDIKEWRDKGSGPKLVNKRYYLSKELMSDNEIEMFLLKNKIKVDKNFFVYDGYHRCFCMIGRILRGEKYIPLVTENSIRFVINNSFRSIPQRSKIKNIGYRPIDNKSRLRQINKNLGPSNFTLLDVGSNYGYFSLSISEKYPNSKVYSVEASFGTGNENIFSKEKNDIKKTKGIQSHYKIKNIYHIFNNHIFCMLMTKDVIKSLLEQNIRFDYQLSLSVFHWIVYEKYGNDGHPNEIYGMLYEHLSLANTTFLELPDIQQETSLKPIYKQHKSVYELLIHMKETYMPDMDIVTLARHNWYGTRYLYKITLDKIKSTKFSSNDLFNICKPLHVY
jgi:hypothetical protein